MLDNMRRQGASIFVYLIFCLLIVIFIINFRPGQSRQGDNGCTGESNLVVEVGDEKVSSGAWHVAYSGQQSFIENMIRMVASQNAAVVSPDYWTRTLGIQLTPTGEIQYRPLTGKGKTHFALETLIRRELLAQEADARGLSATTDLVEGQIMKGWFFLAGERARIPSIFNESGTCESDTACGKGFCSAGKCLYWNGNSFKGFLNELNVSKASFETEQKRSMLAWMMAKVLVDSVQVSRDEALQRFLYEGNVAQYDVVAFKPETYRTALKVTDADLDRYLAAHEDDVKARYKADEITYKKTSPQLFLRKIFIAADKDKQDDAKKKLEAAAAAISAGKQKFVDAAKELNTDEAMKASAGEVGWKKIDAPSLGDKAVSDAVKDLKVGGLSAVIPTDTGVWLLTAENKREGDLSYEQVKHEIAMDLARTAWGKEAARRAAISALEGARNGVGMNLDQLYEKDKTEGGAPPIDLQKIINDPNIPDDVKQKMIEQMILKQGVKHGSIEIEGKDIPAAWYADSDGAGGGAAAGSGASAPAGSAAAGSAAAAGAPQPPPAPPAPPVDLMAPSKEDLPKLVDVAKAHVTRYGPTPREKVMSGLGSSKDAQNAVFEELAPGNIAKKIYEADGSYIVIQLISRDTPDIATFDKDADARIAELRSRRGAAFLDSWLRERCEAMLAKGKIVPNTELLRETDEKGNLLKSQYRPCQSFH
jgi:parvulin-like peptidyl-prolyl isomerase